MVNFALAFAMVMSSAWVTQNQFGLYYWLQLPLWLNVLIGVMVLDFIGAYLIHLLQHKVKLMWRFHLVHHTDVNIDATSANRHHPGESLFRAAFTSLAIFVAGAPFAVVMLYQSLSAILSQFNHANICFPKWLDTAISWFIVSPNMHKVHHHYTQPYTDTNYGNIFSIWDRVFNTFVKKEPNEIVYGIDTHMHEKEHSDIKNLLQIPFQEYRPPTGKFSKP
jgi:sterol desaturase/sphingolipid hydroxylase (fatty acid hydroxylase superfamily)